MMRWGIAGYGWVARDHMAPGIRAAGGRVAAIADPSARVRARAQAEGIAAYATTDAMLAAGACDLLYIATPNDAHLGPARAAAAAQVPFLCEKPLAATLADAEAIGAAAGAMLAGTAFDQRHHPAHVALRDAIADGAIGRPVAVRIVYACWVGPDWSPNAGADAPGNWRADPARAGGGAVIDLAPHGLDLAQMLLGEPLVALHIDLQRRIHAYPVEDGGMLSARTAAGVLLNQHVAYNCAELLPRRRLEVLGETGLLVAADTMGQSAGGTLHRRCGRTGVEQEIAFAADVSPFAAQAAAFMRAAQGDRHDFAMARDVALMRLLDGAYRKALKWL